MENDDLITCPICQVKTEYLTTQHLRKHGYFDIEAFKKEFGIPYLQSARMRSAQSARLLSTGNPTFGQERTPEWRKKISDAKMGKGIGKSGKYERTPAIRNKTSKGVIEAHQRGDYNGVQPGKREYVFSTKANKTIFTRSTWEKRVVWILDNSYEVASFDYEMLVIEYEFEGATHRYIPDFSVKSIFGVKELWEIKRDDFIEQEDPKTMAKLAALKRYCHEHGYNSTVITLKDIQRLERIVKEQMSPDNQSEHKQIHMDAITEEARRYGL